MTVSLRNKLNFRLFCFLFFHVSLPANETNTIELKENGATQEMVVHDFALELAQLKESIKAKFELASNLAKQESSDQEYRSLLSEIQSLKKAKESLEERWRKTFAEDSFNETHALWDIGEVTLSQMIMEYGAADYLYVIPQELNAMKLSIFANIPMPR